MSQSRSFVIQAIGEAVAEVFAIRVLDGSTGTWYSVYPEGVAAKCNVGANLGITFGAKNTGAMDGNIYGRILDAYTGQLFYQGQVQWCHAGDFVYWEPMFTMPPNNLNLTVQVSTNPEFSGASVKQFAVTTENGEISLFDQFWAQFVAFLTGLGVPADMIPPKPPLPALPIEGG
ncbi:MAG TPA: hypothetical protein VMW10_07845 [Alphaproteobacteria bacterium]|nr:hypothetical protein [Alphaproteobacteria bacterium]